MSKNYPRGIEDVEIIRPETMPQTVPSRGLYIFSQIVRGSCLLSLFGIFVMSMRFNPEATTFFVLPAVLLTLLLSITIMNIGVYDRAGKLKTIDPDWEDTRL